MGWTDVQKCVSHDRSQRSLICKMSANSSLADILWRSHLKGTLWRTSLSRYVFLQFSCYMIQILASSSFLNRFGQIEYVLKPLYYFSYICCFLIFFRHHWNINKVITSLFLKCDWWCGSVLVTKRLTLNKLTKWRSFYIKNTRFYVKQGQPARLGRALALTSPLPHVNVV